LGTLQVIIKWRGKPIFIRHRTASEIEEAENIKVETLRDPQTDAERVKKPEWLVMVGKSHPSSYDSPKPQASALQLDPY